MSDPSDAPDREPDADERSGAESGGAEASPDRTDDDTRALDPAEAFSLLGDATRLAIVTTLYERDGALAFSELYDAVDVGDSGGFNYHVQQLVPHFVASTDDGYELTAAGRRIARAIAAGTYTHSPTLEPFELDGRCYACGAAALWGSYDDEFFSIECRDCGEGILSVRAPPSLVRGRDPAEFAAAFERWSRLEGNQAIRGLCPKCGGAVEPHVVESDYETVAPEVVAGYECTVCGKHAMIAPGAVAARAPTVRAFHRERGASLRDRPYWELEQYVGGQAVEVRSRDPWRVRVTFEADGDACHVDLDGDLEVVEARVVPDGATDEGSDGSDAGD